MDFFKKKLFRQINKMLEYINSIDLSEELKVNKIYNLFKTESTEFNSKLLLILKKYKTTKDFINHYTKIDIKSIFNIFSSISINLLKIVNEGNNITKCPDIELYLGNISKIILLFYLIVKNNNSLINIIKSTNTYIQNFYLIKKENLSIKGKVDSFFNELISSSQLFLKRSYSSTSTNDNTNLSINMNFDSRKNNTLNNMSKEKNNNNNTNNEEIPILLRSYTPKFEEENVEHKNNSHIKEAKEEIIVKRDSVKIDSSLTLQKMNFVNIEEAEVEVEVNKAKIKKFNSHKVSHKSSEDFLKDDKNNNKKAINKKGSLFNNRKYSSKSDLDENDSKFRIKLLADFFDTINVLYKKGKINSEKKLKMKQIMISNPKIIIDKFFQKYSNIKKNSDKSLNKNIQMFLLEKFEF